MDAEQRAADGFRIGAEMLADFGQRRLQVEQQLQERSAHVRLVVGLVRRGTMRARCCAPGCAGN